MNHFLKISALVCFVSLAGCSTTQQVTLAKAAPTQAVKVVARAPAEGNSVQMDGFLEQALLSESVTVKPALPAGARTGAGVDAVVSYTDVWRWDMTTYMKSLSVRMFDAQSGDLLVVGEWSDSPMHGFRDAKLVMQGLVSEMLAKVRGATK